MKVIEAIEIAMKLPNKAKDCTNCVNDMGLDDNDEAIAPECGACFNLGHWHPSTVCINIIIALSK